MIKIEEQINIYRFSHFWEYTMSNMPKAGGQTQQINQGVLPSLTLQIQTNYTYCTNWHNLLDWLCVLRYTRTTPFVVVFCTNDLVFLEVEWNCEKSLSYHSDTHLLGSFLANVETRWNRSTLSHYCMGSASNKAKES